ncbi:MAG: Na+-transporting NADH:ubiquinone oxidoreductase subunit D [Bacteroidia bacterium]|nr:MAG: Na+-transporting NADH:ubiquinone oxidoreductase subunit D [Bacteroidia bacterium]
MENMLNIAPSPHVHGKKTTQSLMLDVVIALIPAWLVGLYFFGLGALIVTILSVGTCVLVEWLMARFIFKVPTTIQDGSAVLTGLLLAMNVPSNIPWWILLIGGFVAIAMGKMSFGGLGNNIFNPALFARAFLLVSFPVQMTTWPVPSPMSMAYMDAATGATPLAFLKGAAKGGLPLSDAMGHLPSSADMLVGQMGGSLGEVSALALLLGFGYLLIRHVITWHIPVAIFVTVAVLAGILNLASPEQYAAPVTHLLSGGLMLGAIYMATDYVTSPMSKKGMLLYGLGIGVLTVVIRTWGAYPEGVSFAILIMNAFVPLINRYIKPVKFGHVKGGK